MLTTEEMGNEASKVPTQRRQKQGDDSSASDSVSIGTKSSDLKILLGRSFNDNYVANPKYMLPVDDAEIDRLTMQHYCLRYMFQSNFHAPLKSKLEEGIRVLDVGCGTGIWILEMATDYPNSEFKGTDVANTYPSLIHPPNVTFQLADTTKGLPFPDNYFDFVFMRLNAICFTPAQWPAISRELVRVTKPGGYVEHIEFTVEIKNCGPRMAEWNNALIYALKARGIDPDIAPKIGHMLTEVGIQDVVTDTMPATVGWGGNLGVLVGQNTHITMTATKPMLLPVMAVTEEYYDQMVKETSKELGVARPTYDIWWAYGRKPEI